METIEGVTFEDYAAASAHLAQGVSQEKVLGVLGLDKTAWERALGRWNLRLGALMSEDPGAAARFAAIFADPKVGKFSSAGAPVADAAELAALLPDLETFVKIQSHVTAASRRGAAPADVLRTYGLDVGRWGAVNVRYMKVQNELLDSSRPEFQRNYELFTGLHEKWARRFEAASGGA